LTKVSSPGEFAFLNYTPPLIFQKFYVSSHIVKKSTDIQTKILRVKADKVKKTNIFVNSMVSFLRLESKITDMLDRQILNNKLVTGESR